MIFEVGKPIKADDAARWAELAAPGLAPGEQILGIHAATRMKPSTEIAIVTPGRVILASTSAGGFDFRLEYRLADIVTVYANKMGMNGQVRLDLLDGTKVKFSGKSIVTAKAEAVATAACIEGARVHPEAAAVAAQLPPAEPGFAPTLRPEKVADKYEQRMAATNARFEAKKDVLKARLGEATHPLGDDVVLVGGDPTIKATETILAHCTGDERPWFVLTSQGGAGALAAFDDRLMIIKVGGLTSFMAGSFGGGRVATFHFADVTGIEYNSGILNGVLEVLTPSYSGGANKDFWRGSSASRNADSNDPWTLSNTLPLSKAEHASAMPQLNELRSRIAGAKRTVVMASAAEAAPVAPAAPAAAGGGLAAEIAELATLRDAGVLTDAEFAEAKAKLLRG